MQEQKKKRGFSTVWRESRQLVFDNWRRLAIGLMLMLVSRLAGLVLPGSTKLVIDYVIPEGNRELLMLIALAVVAATLIQATTSFLLSQILGVAAQRSINQMRIRVEEHLTRLPISFFDSTKSGTLISRVMSDAEGIRNLVGTGLVQLTGGIVTATIAMTVLFYLNWKLTLIMMVFLLGFGGAMALAFNKLRPIFRERGKIQAEVTGRLGETFSGIRLVKAYTAEKREDIVFVKGAHRLFRNVARTITSVSSVGALAGLVFGIAGVILMVTGVNAILSGQMTLGDFALYVAMVAMVASPMIQIASIATQLSEAFAGLDRIREVLSLGTEADEESSREPLVQLEGKVVFEDVTFEYTAGVPVLKNISFVAPAGTTTALVGHSGSGKSTLVSLVMAFNQPTSGRILIDGRDLSKIRLRDYRSLLGVVLQDNFLFDGTIGQNIAYSHPNTSRDDILRVSHIAHCDEFIEKFEQQYDTVVGERGVKLSGGQRQRIGIARAILADPRILILDEATSSLDSESEAMIQDGLNSLRRGRTTFVIAHRLSTIRSADQILVLEKGEIIERGTHDELIALNGRYKQLYDKQYRFERNLFINPGEELNMDDDGAETRQREAETQRT